MQRSVWLSKELTLGSVCVLFLNVVSAERYRVGSPSSAGHRVLSPEGICTFSPVLCPPYIQDTCVNVYVLLRPFSQNIRIISIKRQHLTEYVLKTFLTVFVIREPGSTIHQTERSSRDSVIQETYRPEGAGQEVLLAKSGWCSKVTFLRGWQGSVWQRTSLVLASVVIECSRTPFLGGAGSTSPSAGVGLSTGTASGACRLLLCKHIK